jgi:outer membrane lipoprotein
MRLYLTLFLSLFLFACAPVISEEIREKTDVSVTFKEVAQSPDNYEGKIVLWGGEIIQTLPQDDGSVLIEVLERPLGWTKRPQRTVSFRGRFLILLRDPLDPSHYRERARITVAGEIQGSMPGEKIESLSDPTYRYPLLLSKEIHVWGDGVYPYSNVPDVGETGGYRGFEGTSRY